MAVIFARQGYELVPSEVVEICEPQAVIWGYDSVSGGVYAGLCAVKLVILRDSESGYTSAEIHPQPDFICLYEREDLFVGDSVYAADDQKLFAVMHELGDIFPEERKRRISYDNYPAINVNRTQDIPADYDDAVGVPITFLHKYNPEQFEILGFRKGLDDKDLIINGKYPYFRILIRHKKLPPDISRG